MILFPTILLRFSSWHDNDNHAILFWLWFKLRLDDWSLWCSRKDADPGLVESKRAFLPGLVKYSHYLVVEKVGLKIYILLTMI